MGIVIGIFILVVVISIIQWITDMVEGTFLGKIIKFLLGIMVLSLAGGIFFSPLFTISLIAFLLILICLALLWFINIFR